MCSAVCASARNIMRMRFRTKNYDMFKRVLQREKIRLPNDAWKRYLKTWDR